MPSAPTNATGFRALFLPTPSSEAAVFAACVPLLAQSTRLGRAPSASPARAASPSSPSVFSPASPRDENDAQEEEMLPISPGAQPSATTTAAAALSPLFALLSGRVDAALVVLRNRDVVFYDLHDGKLGPKELRRLRPTKVIAKDNTPATSNAATAHATCAALIPLDLAYLCAAQSISNGSPAYLRGVVGSSDGRISVFSESGYAYSCTVHTGAVTRVEPVHVGFSSTQAAKADADLRGRHNSSTISGSGSGGGGGGDSLFKVTAHLGFVTCGEDLRVFLWCRQATAMHLTPHALLDGDASGDFCCARAFAVLQPRVMRGVVSVNGSIPLPLPAQLVFANRHMQPAGLWSLPIRRRPSSTAGSASDAAAAATLLRPVSSSVVDPRRVTAVAVSASGAFCLMACGPALYRLDLCASATSGGGSGSGKSKSQLPSPVKLPVKLPTDVSEIVLHGRLALVVCGEAGVIHVLALGDTPSSIARLGKHVLFQQRRVRSVTLHARACLMTVVDDVAGSVELVQLPEACLGPLMQGDECAGPESVFASAAALRHKCAAEDLLGGAAVEASSPERQSLQALAPSGTEREFEAELLARLIVPSECDRYLHPSQAVL